MNRNDTLREALDHHGFEYFSQTGMPGRVWTVWGNGLYSRRFRTVELEAFLDGYVAGVGR
jgi:hypothetical protein